MEEKNEAVGMSKQERIAWVAFSVFAVATIYLVWSLFFRQSPQTSVHDAGDFFISFVWPTS